MISTATHIDFDDGKIDKISLMIASKLVTLHKA